VPFSGYTVIQVATTEDVADEALIAAAKEADAYPNLNQGVLEFHWEDADVYSTTPPTSH
jgi:hypothetical protein